MISLIDRIDRMIFKINPDYPKIRVILFRQYQTTNEKGTQNDFEAKV